MNEASWLFFPGMFVASLFGAAVGAYFKRRAENLATHDDLDKLVEQMAAVTQTTENIKAAISDDVWDRQRQWELRHDAILEAIRAHADLESALVNLNSCLSGYLSQPENMLTDKTNTQVSEACQRFRDSRNSFMRAYHIANLAVGGQFSKDLSAYFLLSGGVSNDMTDKKSFLDSAKSKALALSGNNVILSARQALGIKDAGDIPQFDGSN